ncbi:response regulator transcription factor [Nocardia sp. NBC_00881]|uniref:response regulator transcription factor n=1 Tax=Nocardia sp. NBC_00881 TaxID=2975995 RepID=UPI00386863C9|nr:response regulator transcription factor [Nocardia sp. NBC_00881]
MQLAVVGGSSAALVTELRMRGLTVQQLPRGADVLRTHHDYDAVILDLELPDMSGLAALGKLRQVSRIPVVMVGTRTDERTVVRSLRGGADDYLVKPARVTELIVRLQSVIRRLSRDRTPPPNMVVAGDVRVDLAGRRVEVAGRHVPLTPMEFTLLRALVRQPNSAVSRQELLDRVWGNAFPGSTRTLDVHIGTLRSKLDRPGLITTLHGYGYLWSGPDPAAEPKAG